MSFHLKKNEKISSRGWFRFINLWVMGPACSHCATLLADENLWFNHILIFAAPPVIKLQPAKNSEVTEGHPIALKVKAECRPGQPVYQWFKGKVPITGQTKGTLLIKNATVANSGYFAKCDLYIDKSTVTVFMLIECMVKKNNNFNFNFCAIF